ncbi:MAG: signal transduction histidine kinase [Myxococcota bacterium]|jgi:signal transduction histidine kinase
MLLMASCVLFGGWLLTRGKTKPLGYWLLGWMALLVGGFLRLSALPSEVGVLFGVAFAALSLAGAYRYIEREVPPYIVPVGAVTAVVLALTSLTPMFGLVCAIGLGLELSALVYAGFLVHRAASAAKRAWFHRAIGPGLLLIAVLEGADYLGILAGTEQIMPWLFVGIPLAMVQIVAVVHIIQSRSVAMAAELERSIALLQATLDSSTEGLLVVSRSGEISSLNGAFASLWQIPQEILARRDDSEALEFAMTQLADPEAFLDKVKELYDRPADESYDTIDFKDGRVFDRYSRPQYIGDEVVGRVWSFRDATERRRTDALNAIHQNHLEELVEERTQELVESRDRLRQADRLVAVGTLAAGVAHQINNPVGAIMNSAEYALMCEGEDDAEATFKSALESNVREAKRCAEIVRSMLQFAREQPVETRVDDLNQVVQRACRATRSYAHERGAEVIVNLCDAPLAVKMSAIEIEQVMVNIIRNAIESQEFRCRVQVESELKGDLARVQITDNGRGIDARDKARVFDPFYSTRVEEGGTGLGLSVAHGIIREHDGVITTDSDEGKGTVFTIELPIAKA